MWPFTPDSIERWSGCECIAGLEKAPCAFVSHELTTIITKALPIHSTERYSVEVQYILFYGKWKSLADISALVQISFCRDAGNLVPASFRQAVIILSPPV